MAKSTSKTADDLGARFAAAAGAAVETSTPRKRTAPRKRTTAAPEKAAADAGTPEAAPTSQRLRGRVPEAPNATNADRYPVRVNLFISEAMKRDLALAQLDDGIEMSARIRGMIEYWREGRPQSDPETGEPGKPARATAAIDMRARRLGR